jgi:leucine dehydrogenase
VDGAGLPHEEPLWRDWLWPIAVSNANLLEMAMHLEQVIADWDGEQVVVRFDEPSGAWMFVCIHSRRLGPAGGGTRMKVYGSPAEALRDGTRLAAGMTAKFAVSGLPFGGGKAVLAVPRLPEGGERRELLRRYADLICTLGGNYLTGCDMNTTPADLDAIRETCPYTFGHSAGSGEPGPFTARGVFHGICASLGHADGSPTPKGRVVLVQGLGSVGARLAAALAEAGADVVLTDVDTERASALAAELGARTVEPEQARSTECDVYAPCAAGGTLSAEAIPELRCRIVAGAANNQLGEPADADRLRERGILYAPDFVINSGGVFHNVGREALGWGDTEVDRALVGIGSTLLRIYRRSDAEGISTGRVAQAIAEERLAEPR